MSISLIDHIILMDFHSKGSIFSDAFIIAIVVNINVAVVAVIVFAFECSSFRRFMPQMLNLGQHPVVFNSNKITVDHNKK